MFLFLSILSKQLKKKKKRTQHTILLNRHADPSRSVLKNKENTTEAPRYPPGSLRHLLPWEGGA